MTKLLRRQTDTTELQGDYSGGSYPTDSTRQWSRNPFSVHPISGTDSHLVFLRETHRKDVEVVDFRWESPTFGDTKFIATYQFLDSQEVTGKAQIVVNNFSDKTISSNAGKVLRDLERLIKNLGISYEVPPILAFIDEGQELLIEWIFEHYRIGFSFEAEVDNPSWYLVSDSKFGDTFAHGKLVNSNYASVIQMLLKYVTSSIFTPEIVN